MSAVVSGEREGRGTTLVEQRVTSRVSDCHQLAKERDRDYGSCRVSSWKFTLSRKANLIHASVSIAT